MEKKRNIKADMLPVGKKRFSFVIIFSIVMLFAGFILNVSLGSVALPVKDIFSAIGNYLKLLFTGIFTGDFTKLSLFTRATTLNQILFSIRLPRMFLSAILGGALAVSGYLLQVFFRNPIAGPFVLGISSGAKMAVGITLIFLARLMTNISSFTLIAAAFVGSLLITSVILLFSQKLHSMSMLLVIGIMVGYICSAVTDLCVTFANEHDVVNLTGWSMGSFSGASWENVLTAFIFSVPCIIGAILLSKPISAYSLGEDYAQSMGVRVKPFRCALILLSSLLSACVTALAGPISFVGIAVPHIARILLKSSKPVHLIPVVFIVGAAFCVCCDLIARTLFAPTELSAGTVTSIFGAPIVIYLMINRRRFKEV